MLILHRYAGQVGVPLLGAGFQMQAGGFLHSFTASDGFDVQFMMALFVLSTFVFLFCDKGAVELYVLMLS